MDVFQPIYQFVSFFIGTSFNKFSSYMFENDLSEPIHSKFFGGFGIHNGLYSEESFLQFAGLRI